MTLWPSLENCRFGLALALLALTFEITPCWLKYQKCGSQTGVTAAIPSVVLTL
jgi:hypothetical protein